MTQIPKPAPKNKAESVAIQETGRSIIIAAAKSHIILKKNPMVIEICNAKLGPVVGINNVVGLDEIYLKMKLKIIEMNNV